MSAKRWELSRSLAESLCSGRWIGRDDRVSVSGAAIDSRLVNSGSIFACFRGEHVDGHDYAGIAVGNGAALIIASEELDVPVPVLLVEDVSVAMMALARYFRQQYQGATWIGITGSNGKTTVKDLVRAILKTTMPVHATSGNFNNQLGVPLTVLNTPADQKAVVVECGTNAPGEIAQLCAVCQPDIGVITSIAAAHLQGLGSLEGVAEEKSAMFKSAKRCILGNVNLKESCFDICVAAAGNKELTIIGKEEVDQAYQEGTGQICLGDFCVPVPGLARHMALNSLISITVARDLDVSDDAALKGLEQVQRSEGRMQQIDAVPHKFINDAYNANPHSMRAALQYISRQPGARLAVLGPMRELGNNALELHRELGAEAARLGVAIIVLGDEHAQAIADGFTQQGGVDLAYFTERNEAVDAIVKRCGVGTQRVIFKASRSERLEEVIALVQQELQKQGRTDNQTVEENTCSAG